MSGSFVRQMLSITVMGGITVTMLGTLKTQFDKIVRDDDRKLVAIREWLSIAEKGKLRATPEDRNNARTLFSDLEKASTGELYYLKGSATSAPQTLLTVAGLSPRRSGPSSK